jgi:hypothetical protein
MPLRPEIALAGRDLDVGQAFRNSLVNVQGIEEQRQAPVRSRLLEAQTSAAEEAQAQQKQVNEFTSIAMGAMEVLPFLNSGDLEGARDALMLRRGQIIQRGGDTTQTDQAIGLLGQEGGVEKLKLGSERLIAQAQQMDILKPSATAKDDFTLKAGEKRFDRGGTVIAEVKGDLSEAPEGLLRGLSSVERERAKAAFSAAGGGKEGVKALNESIKITRETTQREDVPQILDSSFPNASPAERAQLEAVMTGAKTVESGLKQADKIRAEQRRLKKAKGFQERAVSLLDNILSSDQLGDVTGSIEGAIDFRFTDVEAELVADIDEAQNILTAENMDLMTGVLSESDIKLLKNLSSGALNRRRGVKRFIKDATLLRDKLNSQLVQTVDDTSKTRLVFDPASGQLVPK